LASSSSSKRAIFRLSAGSSSKGSKVVKKSIPVIVDTLNKILGTGSVSSTKNRIIITANMKVSDLS
jgi:hypothetical protein